ncbi:MAG TPA: hypothetical protein VJR27_01235 [Candidatus Saccharimonadales bacterium]|nr:hypothetical protein [Candidatus Saccharimonadales bacterium]
MTEFYEQRPSPSELADGVMAQAFSVTRRTYAELAELEQQCSVADLGRTIAQDAVRPMPESEEDLDWDNDTVPAGERDTNNRNALLRAIYDMKQRHKGHIVEARKSLADITGLSNGEYFGDAAALYVLDPTSVVACAEAEAKRSAMMTLIERFEAGTPVMGRDLHDLRDVPVQGGVVGGRVHAIARTPVWPNPVAADIGIEINIARAGAEPLTLVRDMCGLLDPFSPNFLRTTPEEIQEFRRQALQTGEDPQTVAAALAHMRLDA